MLIFFVIQVDTLPLLETMDSFLAMGKVLMDETFDDIHPQSLIKEMETPKTSSATLPSERKRPHLKLTHFGETSVEHMDFIRMELLCPNIQHLKLINYHFLQADHDPSKCRKVSHGES